MYLIYTNHVLDQVKNRKWLVWNKAKIFLKSKFKEIKDNWSVKNWENGSYIVTGWGHKIVFSKVSKLEYKLITYAFKSKMDTIEYWLMKILKCT